MPIKTTLKLTALSALTALAYTSHAQAEGKLTVYCSVQNVVCEKVTQAFSKKYNVDAQLEVFTLCIKTERTVNPNGKGL